MKEKQLVPSLNETTVLGIHFGYIVIHIYIYAHFLVKDRFLPDCIVSNDHGSLQSIK